MNLCAPETEVSIEGICLDTFVGLKKKERSSPQTILIDIRCALQDPEVPADDLTRTLDYVPIVKAVRVLCEERERKLIETLAEEIATVCLSYPVVRRVTVSVRKPQKLANCTAVGTTRSFIRKGS